MTEIYNRPGLGELRYRAGTFGSVREAMLKQLALQPELAALTARQSEDYGVALSELWAYLADILTFYQERYVQEAFLRTAVHRDSLTRLGALLGYRPQPGVAAQTHVAFQVEASGPVDLPAGLRIQSVPGPGEQPRKYESVEPVRALQALNRLRIYPHPVAVNPLEAGSRGGALQPGFDPARLKAGDRLALTSDSHFSVIEKSLTALKPDGSLTTLTFDPPMEQTWQFGTSYLFQLRRMLQTLVPQQAAPKAIARDAETEPVTSYLDLDGTYQSIRDNTRAIVFYEHSPGTWMSHLTTISWVVPTSADTAGVTVPVTRIYLTPPIPATGITRATVYELGEQIPLWGAAYPAQIDAGTDTVCLPMRELGPIPPLFEQGRTLLLADDDGPPEAVRITGTRAALLAGADHLELSFQPPLSRPLAAASAVLYGNVALATHGETVRQEILGSGDPTVAGQRFTLKKEPVTFVRTDQGAMSTLTVAVDGVRWQEVESLLGHGPDARVYVTDLDENGGLTVRFGDGITGTRLPRGTGNVVATYRQGSGTAGAVRAGTLTSLLDRPRGLKAALNPGPASGGQDPQTEAGLRTAIPATVRTFGRAVSRQDFEDLALSYPGVAKARADLIWDGLQQAIYLTMAGRDGAPVDCETLRRYLDDRRDPRRALLVANYQPVAVRTRVFIQVDPAYDGEQVRSSAAGALEAYFAFAAQSFGQSVHRSDIYRVVQAVPGVTALVVDQLDFAGRSGGGSRDTLAIAPARLTAAGPAPAEMATVADPAADITVVRRDSL